MKRSENTCRNESGKRFTLIELLICIAVIMILVAMLMPALSRVKHRAKQVVCGNQLKQNGVAMIQYAAENSNRWQVFFDHYGVSRTHLRRKDVNYDMRLERQQMLTEIDEIRIHKPEAVKN